MKKLTLISALLIAVSQLFGQVTLVSTTKDYGPSNSITYKYSYVCRGNDTTIQLPTTLDNYSIETMVHGSSLNSSTAYLFYRTSSSSTADSLKTTESFVPADSILLAKNRFGYWNVKFRSEMTSAQYNYLSIIHNSLTAGKLWIYVTTKKRI